MQTIGFTNAWENIKLTNPQYSLNTALLIEAINALSSNDNELLKWANAGIRLAADDLTVGTFTEKINVLSVNGKSNITVTVSEDNRTIDFSGTLDLVIPTLNDVNVTATSPVTVVKVTQPNETTGVTETYYRIGLDTAQITTASIGPCKFESVNDTPQYLDKHFLQAPADINNFIFPELKIVYTADGTVVNSTDPYAWSTLVEKMAFVFRMNRLFGTEGKVKLTGEDPFPTEWRKKFLNKDFALGTGETADDYIFFKSILVVQNADGSLRPMIGGEEASAKMAFYVERDDLLTKVVERNETDFTLSSMVSVDRFDTTTGTLRDDRESPVIINGKLYETYGTSNQFYDPANAKERIPVRSIVKTVDGEQKIFFYMDKNDVLDPKLVPEPSVTFEEPILVERRQDADVYNIVAHANVHRDWRWHTDPTGKNKFNYRIANASFLMIDEFLNSFRDQGLTITWKDGISNQSITAPLWGMADAEVVALKGDNTTFMKRFLEAPMATYEQIAVNQDSFSFNFIAEVHRPATASVKGSELTIELKWIHGNTYTDFAWIETDPKYFDITTLFPVWVGYSYQATNGNTAKIVDESGLYSFAPKFKYENGIKYLVLPDYFIDNMKRINKTVGTDGIVTAYIQYIGKGDYESADQTNCGSLSKVLFNSDKNVLGTNELPAYATFVWTPGKDMQWGKRQRLYYTKDFNEPETLETLDKMFPGYWVNNVSDQFRVTKPTWWNIHNYANSSLDAAYQIGYRKSQDTILVEDLSAEIQPNGNATVVNVITKLKEATDVPKIVVVATEFITIMRDENGEIEATQAIWPNWLTVNPGEWTVRTDAEGNYWATVPYTLTATDITETSSTPGLPRTAKLYFKAGPHTAEMSVHQNYSYRIIPSVDELIYDWYGGQTYRIDFESNVDMLELANVPAWIEVVNYNFDHSKGQQYVFLRAIQSNVVEGDVNDIINQITVNGTADEASCTLSVNLKAKRNFTYKTSTPIATLCFKADSLSEWIGVEARDDAGWPIVFHFAENMFDNGSLRIELNETKRLFRIRSLKTNYNTYETQTVIPLTAQIYDNVVEIGQITVVNRPYGQGNLYFKDDLVNVPSQSKGTTIRCGVVSDLPDWEVDYDSVNDSRYEISKFYNELIVNVQRDNISLDVDVNEYRDWHDVAAVYYNDYESFTKRSEIAFVQRFTDLNYNQLQNSASLPTIVDSITDSMLRSSNYPEGQSQISGTSYVDEANGIVVTKIVPENTTSAFNEFTVEQDIIIHPNWTDQIRTSKHYFALQPTGGTATVRIESNVFWSYSTEDTWYKLQRTNTGIKIVYDANSGLATKTGTIVIQYGNSVKQFPVFQHPNTQVDIRPYPTANGGVLVAYGFIVTPQELSSTIATYGGWDRNNPLNAHTNTYLTTNLGADMQFEWVTVESGIYTYTFPVINTQMVLDNVNQFFFERCDTGYDGYELMSVPASAISLSALNTSQRKWRNGEWMATEAPSSKRFWFNDGKDIIYLIRPSCPSAYDLIKIEIAAAEGTFIAAFTPWRKVEFSFAEEKQRFAANFDSDFSAPYINRITMENAGGLSWLKANMALIPLTTEFATLQRHNSQTDFAYIVDVLGDNSSSKSRHTAFAAISDIGTAILHIEQVGAGTSFCDIISVPYSAIEGSSQSRTASLAYKVRSSDLHWTITGGSKWLKWSEVRKTTDADPLESSQWQFAVEAQLPSATTRRLGHFKIECGSTVNYHQVVEDFTYYPQAIQDEVYFSTFITVGVYQSKTVSLSNVAESQYTMALSDDKFVNSVGFSTVFDPTVGREMLVTELSTDKTNIDNQPRISFLHVTFDSGTEKHIKVIPIIQKRFSTNLFIKNQSTMNSLIPENFNNDVIADFKDLPVNVYGAPYLELVATRIPDNAKLTTDGWSVTDCPITVKDLVSYDGSTYVSNYCTGPIRFTPMNGIPVNTVVGFKIHSVGEAGIATTTMDYAIISIGFTGIAPAKSQRYLPELQHNMNLVVSKETPTDGAADVIIAARLAKSPTEDDIRIRWTKGANATFMLQDPTMLSSNYYLRYTVTPSATPPASLTRAKLVEQLTPSDLLIVSASMMVDGNPSYFSDICVSVGKLLSMLSAPIVPSLQNLCGDSLVTEQLSTRYDYNTVTVSNFNKVMENDIYLYGFDGKGSTTEYRYAYYWYVISEQFNADMLDPQDKPALWLGNKPPFASGDPRIEQVNVSDVVDIIGKTNFNTEIYDFYNKDTVFDFGDLTNPPTLENPKLRWIPERNMFANGVFAFRQLMSQKLVSCVNEITLYQNNKDSFNLGEEIENTLLSKVALQGEGLTKFTWMPPGELKYLKIETADVVRNAATQLTVKIPLDNGNDKCAESENSCTRHGRLDPIKLSMEWTWDENAPYSPSTPIEIDFYNGAGANSCVNIIVTYQLVGMDWTVELGNDGDWGRLISEDAVPTSIKITNTGKTALVGYMQLSDPTSKSGFVVIPTPFSILPAQECQTSGCNEIEWPLTGQSEDSIIFFDPTKIGTPKYEFAANLKLDIYTNSKMDIIYRTVYVPLKAKYKKDTYTTKWIVNGTEFVQEDLLKDFDAAVLNTQMIAKILGVSLPTLQTYSITASTDANVFGGARLEIDNGDAKTVAINSKPFVSQSLTTGVSKCNLDESKVVYKLFNDSATESTTITVNIVADPISTDISPVVKE